MTFFAGPVQADDAITHGPRQVAPGVEWTTFQDLKPNAVAANTPIKQKWAVVIGASKFQEHKLIGPEQMDAAARDFNDYLLDAHGGRMHPDHVKLLTNSAATRQNIMSTLGSSWLGSLAGPDDLVIVFISTNAFPATDDTTYLCAYDCALDNIYSTCISMQNLMDTLKKYVPSHRILLIVQSAYSGAAELSGAKALSGAKELTGAKAIFSGYNIDVDKVALGKGYIILSSSQPDQITWGDAFSRNLIAALRLQDGLINLQDAFAIARRKTETETGAAGKKQTPTMKSDWSGNNLVIGAPPIEQVSAIPSSVASFVAAESHYLRANNALIKGDKATAASEYQAAIGDDGKYADAICDYGALEFMNEKFDHAAQLYEKAIAIRPDDELMHANYARVLAALGQADKAKAELQAAYRLNPKDLNVLAALGSRYVADSDFPQAEEMLKQAVQLAPNSDSLHQRLSYIYSKSGNGTAALHEAQQAARLNPKSVTAILNLGSIALMNGDRTQALKTYQQALQLEPNNPDAHFFLSKLYEAAGDWKRALHELNSFLQCCRTDDPRGLAARQHFTELAAHQQ